MWNYYLPYNMACHFYTPCTRSLGVYRNHPVCLSFRLSVKSKLNLDHNFWTESDRALILHKCIPCDKTFLSIPKFLTCDLDLDFWLTFEKVLNLGHNFWTKRDRALIFHMYISCGNTFLLEPKFFTSWLWLLTYFWKKLNLDHNLWTKSDRALIFHTSIPCDKTFPLIPIYLN